MHKKSILMSASLICADMLNLNREIDELEKASINMIHFDVMDGNFVPRFGLHPEIIYAVRKKTKIPIDVHMMVSDPEPYIESFAKAGADIITVHVENNMHLDRTIRLIRQNGSKVGLAINPATDVSLLKWSLIYADYILIMGINPGILGHAFCEHTVEKIKEIISMRTSLGSTALIAVDGGVSKLTIPSLIKAGTEVLICGSATIFKPDIALGEAVIDLRNFMEKLK